MAKKKSKIKQLPNYEWMRNLLEESLRLFDSVNGFSQMLYYENAHTTIDIEERKQFWQDLLSNLQSLRDNYSVEFTGLFNSQMFDFVVSQIQPLEDLINEIDKWLDTFRHENLYVYKKRLEVDELAELKALVYESL